ncbi:MAG: hypothetical protein J6J22_07100 [Alistipes sp.]|nr:hypothetical protein [Alistipes sp.]MBP3644400.1 hypothetical protein [Alistipes sp.]
MPRLNTTGDAVKQSSCTSTPIVPHSFMMSFLDKLCDRAWDKIDNTIDYDDEYEDPATGLTWQLSARLSFNEGYREPAWVEVYDAHIFCVNEENDYIQTSLSHRDFSGLIYDYVTRRLVAAIKERDDEKENLRNLEYQFNMSRV